MDDDPDTADSYVELLALWGYDAVACYDAGSALSVANARWPDAVLLDSAMPGVDGFRFAQLFRALPGCGSVPIIPSSGYSDLASRACGWEMGAYRLLLKPDELKAALSLALAPAVAPDRPFGTAPDFGWRSLAPAVGEGTPAPREAQVPV